MHMYTYVITSDGIKKTSFISVYQIATVRISYHGKWKLSKIIGLSFGIGIPLSKTQSEQILCLKMNNGKVLYGTKSK